MSPPRRAFGVAGALGYIAYLVQVGPVFADGRKYELTVQMLFAV
jgi:hypothetical protein